MKPMKAISIACITEAPVTFDSGGKYALKLFSGISDECDALSVRCDILTMRQYRALKSTRRYDGFILWKIHEHTPAIEALAQTRPSVWLLTPPAQGSAVIVDADSAIRGLIDHLLAEGFTRIGFFNTIDLPWAHERYAVYRTYLRKKGISVDPAWVCGYSPSGNYDLPAYAWKHPAALADEYLTRNARADAVLCANDTLAYHMLRRAGDRGLHIPRDIALTGFDDRAEPDAAERVTTARTDFRDIGRRAARLLFEMITGARRERRTIIRHRAEIIIRHTSLKRSFTDDVIRGFDFREAVYALIRERYRETRLSEALSASCGYAHEYFLIKFAKTFGTTFSRFIARYRVERAKDILLTTKKSVTEIVFESGFPHLQNFYTAFKRETGMAPAAYRRRH